MKIWNMRSYYDVNISNDKAELCEEIMSVKLFVIVIIDFKRYLSTYCLMQGSCLVCSNFITWNIYLKIRITIFKFKMLV